jgi:hypothetical protein
VGVGQIGDRPAKIFIGAAEVFVQRLNRFERKGIFEKYHKIGGKSAQKRPFGLT